MKRKIIIIFSLISLFNINFTLAEILPSTSVALNSNVIGTGANAAGNGAYGSQKMAGCSSRRFDNCIKAAAGFAQLITSLMQMMGTAGSRDALSPGTDWSMPGFETQIGPIHPDDRDYFDPILNAVETGQLVDYQNARDELMERMQPDLDRLSAMGIDVDKTNGSITTPPGSPSLADLGGIEEGSRFDEYNDKTVAALGGSGAGSSGGGSSGGSGGIGGRSTASIGSGSGIDSFLNKLDKGDLNSDKLVGMSKNTKDGDAIGVAMGNLFKMVHVRYKTLNTKNEFK